jgi:ubiquinone/menaquinone biosynthesis C-methylase UbiE
MDARLASVEEEYMDSIVMATVEAWRGERMYWDLASGEDRQLHLSRYQFASELFNPHWRCLDAACGSGYGSSFLAEKVRFVEGVDVDPDAIDFARTTYRQSNLSYHCADLQSMLPFPEETFDAITSFETLEHVSDQTKMTSEFHRVLKPGGILVISTPDRKMSERIGLDNHFHVAELSKREFVDLLSRSFIVERLFGHGHGKAVAKQWRLIHQFLKLGTRFTSSKIRSRIESALARPFGRLRARFYNMSSSPIQPDTDIDRAKFVHVIAVARRRG